MAKGFLKVRYHVADKDDVELRSIGTRSPARRGLAGGGARDDADVTFNSDEAAARFYVRKVFERDPRPGVRGLGASDRAESMPDLETVAHQSIGLTKTKIVKFAQTHATIPIFGSNLNVEIDGDRELVDIIGNVADEGLEGLPTVPGLSPAAALGSIADLTGAAKDDLAGVQPPKLYFYRDQDKDAWHLVYFFKEVPAAPKDFQEGAGRRASHGHGSHASPRLRKPLMNYLVDAHHGAVLLYYSATPLLAIPSRCKGRDEADREVKFFGRRVNDRDFEMFDPMRMIRTYDHQLKDVDNDPLPTDPLRNQGVDFGDANRAAVSAHVNARVVDKFLRSVLMRDGIDDKGMSLESIVNCTSAADEQPPEWHNAFWWKKKMWYGQLKDDAGNLKSYSSLLDVIAHELMHGVTESSAGLIYFKQSGALNESFSDIFGIVISNLEAHGEDSDAGDWSWEIGPGLGKNALPLRDMSDPTRTGDPDHMDDYLVTTHDSGGVHTNSNIHNKAAYNLFTAVDGDGSRVFDSLDVAILYYLCLIRLGSMATFRDTVETLVDVAKVYFAGAADLNDKIGRIESAYKQVGIK